VPGRGRRPHPHVGRLSGTVGADQTWGLAAVLDQQQHTTDEILVAIGREVKAQTEDLRKIRTSVGFLALVTLISIIVSAVAVAVAGNG
jgi:hypothetical protein